MQVGRWINRVGFLSEETEKKQKKLEETEKIGRN